MREPIRVINTILYCHRWQETVSFYRDILGFSVTFENNWFVEFAVTSNARLSVANEQRATVKSARGQGLTLAFQVDKADATWQSLKARGVNVGKIADHPWGGRAFFLFDPEGNRLEVWSVEN
ncbi:MAG: glyoxalase/bleomycin resistance/dioxygenase family protein [Candidatus Brocadia sp. AMX2]|uniref:Lactoylglutathione lyase and related lyases n=1 Tax=Candidatus Brocadia sinica JPN1 TaxID=1197129 RepID=A0ABQ0JS82_9BACT|nr:MULTISPECIES: VOC family protein [Brocadia]KXK29029.1 MAG: Glyoxalase-like domain protein [Candidatus Brocadia sinica]MBC6933106.1 glyoxalase/bleomycin resistance/dioxygenase family protein [Candidatus Brocadia sp.]MBL1168415.1 glyoxalase/bleomycin resistance/dioxygenase family protein [Candidatus Brocadia sp. AMX1]NOG43178.1 glyoxalase/bleomycin resistance/dioxygenase family protein [Planctomycetota bacterium]KAA0242834.1 MAG: glyoxalase/bleomycin resistance/dioxygenase family protein [Can